ncbi:MAG: Nif3-like dinuclear metal center hexameric protein [Lachnospiraceae bacterium]|nr:Nif3-like dinuclear metal center hexameric protein [Lachnospiraceae bacterium]
MRCSEIIERLELHSPPSFAEDWDNVGLLAGRREKEVSSVFVSLDAGSEQIDEAIRLKADMIITHHPMIFKAIKRATDEDFIGERIVKLLRYDISYYAMHTNFDVMGMADAAADNLQLTQRKVLDVTFEDELSTEGIGRTGRLPVAMPLRECAMLTKSAFDVPDVRVYGDTEKQVELVALCPGSGRSMIAPSLAQHCDVLITGDIDYHTGIDAVAQGLCIIDAGHYGIEKLFIPYMRDFLHRELPTLTVHTARVKEPYVTI